MATSSRIFLPFALWPEKAPSLSVTSLYLNPVGDDLITGTLDGFLICWKIVHDQRQIIPRLMLIGHTNQISFIVASTSSHKLEQFVSISDNDGEIKLWSNEDGRCLEHIRTNLKHRSVQSFHYQLTNEHFLICCGCYSEILFYDMRTLELKYTLTPSHVDADWISTFSVFQKPNAQDVIISIGLLDSGCVKLWAFDPRTASSTTGIEATSFGNNNNVLPVDLKEHESKEIRTEFGSIIVPCEECQRMMLFLHGRGWQILDGIDFNELCSYRNEAADHWTGGHFPTLDLVVLFSARGFANIFRLPENATLNNSKFRSQHNKTDHQKPQWLCRLSVNNESKLDLMPIFSSHTKSKLCQIYRADSSGQISVWSINLKNFSSNQIDKSSDISATWSISYNDVWKKTLSQMNSVEKVLNGILLEKVTKLTSTCHLTTMDRLAFGTDDGQIFLLPALKLISSLFNEQNASKNEFNSADLQTLIGHQQAITCLVHPHSEYTRYEIQHFLSASLDHSVRLWDLSSGHQLHVFNVHSGPVLMFHIPPPMLNVKVQFCVCSIGSDHTVALLHLKEFKIVLLANRQRSPIVGLRWRINDDFLLIKCFDGSLFVWQIETGNLDRVAYGVLADELFEWYNDPRIINGTSDLPNDALTPPMTPAHFLQIRSTGKRRDADTIRKCYRKIGLTRQDLIGMSSFKQSEYRLPIVIQQFHTNLGDDVALFVLFDLLQLVSQIIVFDLEKQHLQKTKHIETANKENQQHLNQISSSLSTLSNFLVSLLHPWLLDKSTDEICLERLHLKRNHRYLSYGILSKNEHLALVLPMWLNHLNDHVPESALTSPSRLISFIGMETQEELQQQKQDKIAAYVYHWRWKYSSILNTEHLLSLVTMVYILMNCDRWINNSSDDQSLFVQRDGWSKLLHFYCSDMLEQCQTKVFQSLSIEILCSHWQDLCLELRDASRKLLEKELDHLHSNPDAWHIFISKWSNLFSQLFKKDADGALYDTDIRDIFLDDMTFNNETTTTTVKEQYKTQQLLSIILMGIVGTRYGQEIEPTKQSNAPIKGFTVESPELILKLGGLLTSLLSPVNFDHIPLHSVIRRTAIDLIGRGYTAWEPYLDVGQVLLTLLELCAISDSSTVSSKQGDLTIKRHENSVLSGILTPKADTCLTARTALTLIATSRSNVVIITLSRELAKHALAQSGTVAITTARAMPTASGVIPPLQTALTIKNEQKNEILRLVKILIEKCPHDVADLILEVTDITLNCIDLSVLRHKGVQAISETFGLLLRYPMVTYCQESPKLCVGTRTGSLALYDLKTSKYQSFQAHPKNDSITCVEFSPDGKYLASYSAYEGYLYFWQTGSNTFFSSSSSISLVSRQAAQQLERTIPSPMRKVDMNWIDRTTVRMFWHVNRSEKKFTI